MYRLFKIATIASTVIYALLTIIWSMSYSFNLSRGIETSAPSDSIPLIFDYRLGFEDGAVWIYNYKMPYRGGIMLLASTNDPPSINRFFGLGDYGFGHKTDFERHNKISMTENYCDLPGIYFRQFWDPGQGSAYATLRVSLWYPALLSAVLPLCWISRHVVFRKKSN
jgi:hypothetical protein